ncbi:hypothetical protein EIP86_005358 [Pleurotus ostreatoroseus]|nr:hypothetical protein EIP86_005358 [Pleurotus ostreatoroseus]
MSRPHRSKPRRLPTDPSRMRWVLLGAGEDSGVYMTRESTFLPLILVVTSPTLAAEYKDIVPFFNLLADVSNDKMLDALNVMQAKSLIFRELINLERKFHALLFGIDNHRGYYMLKADLYPYLCGKPGGSIYKKAYTLRQAMEWMLSHFTTNVPIPSARSPGQIQAEVEAATQAMVDLHIVKAKKKVRVVSPPSQSSARAHEDTRSESYGASSSRHRSMSDTRSTSSNAPSTAQTSSRTYDDTRPESRDPLPSRQHHRSEDTRSASSSAPSAAQSSSRTHDASRPEFHSASSQHPHSAGMIPVSPVSSYPRVFSTSPEPITSYVRDRHGIITKAVRRNRKAKPIAKLDVPSLGSVVDDVLDSFGYDSALIDFLNINFRASESCEEFVKSVDDWVPRNEAEFYWRHIRLPEGQRERVRNVPWIIVD